MKITAPISRVEEADVLAAAGADELYCGVVPEDWVDRFGTAGVSRRVFANLRSYAELREAVRRAHDGGARISLALNAQHYDEAQIEALADLAARFEDMGGDAVIVGDAAALAVLGAKGLALGIHVSSIATCRSAESAGFFADLGATRVVFPRHVTVAEMAAVAAAEPLLEYEAFVLNDGCVFDEGACLTLHLPGKLGGPICLDRYDYAYVRTDGRDLDPDERRRAERNEAAYESWLWYRFGCGFSVTADGLPYGPCGLCALAAMAEGGVGHVKIAGREAATERKRRSVEFVREAIGVLDSQGRDALFDYATNRRGEPERCATGFMCYYPEVLPPIPGSTASASPARPAPERRGRGA